MIVKCKYGWNNCSCCEGIDNPIYPCKWEEDNFINIVESSNKHKRRIRHKKNYISRAYIRNVDKAHKARLKFLAENIHMYPCPVIYTDKIWIKEYGYVDNPKPYYKGQYCGRGKHSASHYHKKMSNRKIRRYKGELPKKGNLGHRLYDFWWKIS